MLPFKFLKKKSCICKHTMSDKVRLNRVNDNTQIDRWRPILFQALLVYVRGNQQE